MLVVMLLCQGPPQEVELSSLVLREYSTRRSDKVIFEDRPSIPNNLTMQDSIKLRQVAVRNGVSDGVHSVWKQSLATQQGS